MVEAEVLLLYLWFINNALYRLLNVIPTCIILGVPDGIGRPLY